MHQPEVQAFVKNLHHHLLALQQEIRSGKVQIGNYRYFTIYDPKERIICAGSFKERVLHHALMNVCHPYFEKYQIYDSYACRPQKGTYKALDRARYFSAKYAYFAKLDVRKYFETIDQTLLKTALRRLFKDNHLLRIFYQIINSYQTAPQKGLPIGNLCSQYFANHFLAQADHYAKQTLRMPAYVRYMDDMVLWHHHLPTLHRQVKQFEQFLQQQLNCTLKPTIINAISHGLPYLGYVVWQRSLTLASRSRKRFKRKALNLNRQLAQNTLTQEHYRQHMLPLLAFVQKAASYRLRQQVFANLP